MGLLRQELLGRLCNTRNDSPADALRPFDKDHAGMVIGEGGGLMIFEDVERAIGRDGKIYKLTLKDCYIYLFLTTERHGVNHGVIFVGNCVKKDNYKDT